MGWHPGIVVGAALCVAATAALAQSSPFVGHWHYNRAQSTPPPEEEMPTDLALDITRVDALHVQWSMTIKNAQGRPEIEAFDAPANGEFYAVSSNTMVAFRLSPGAIEADFKGPAGEGDQLVCRLSPDGRRLTCAGRLSGADGKTSTYTDVFDRG